ncbi:hypothetical protein Acidovoranil_01630 [Acidovorax sp. FG27]
MTTEHGTQQAAIQGEVTYREGDGMPVAIPEGPVELTHAPDSVTLSWKADNDAAGLAAMPRDQFERYAREGKILVDGEPAVAPQSEEDDAGTEAGASQAAPDTSGQQSQSRGPDGAQVQSQGSADQPVSDPEVSQDGHAVEHDYTDDLTQRQGS